MRFNVLLSIMPISVASCHDPSTALLSSSVENGSPAIETDARAYELEAGSTGYTTTIGFMFTNPSQAAVYVANCRGIAPPSLEKLVNGEWVGAWSAVVPRCLSAPIVIKAGQEYQGTLHLFAGYPASNVYPKFETPQISGVYRLVWHNVLTSFDSGAYPSGPELSKDQRVSNSFRLATP
jgi:hypothetical protein